ncbi:MAG: hypothetical protein AAF902_02085 [Chloroflexota bacterium]
MILRSWTPDAGQGGVAFTLPMHKAVTSPLRYAVTIRTFSTSNGIVVDANAPSQPAANRITHSGIYLQEAVDGSPQRSALVFYWTSIFPNIGKTGTISRGSFAYQGSVYLQGQTAPAILERVDCPVRPEDYKSANLFTPNYTFTFLLTGEWS